jgi:glyoxylase I family protein
MMQAMKIEHVALQVADPVALARWYRDHLGLTIKRAQTESPFGQFLADDGDAVMLEVYNNPNAPVPDYHAVDPLALHLAFWTDDVKGTRERLLAAGAIAEGEVVETPAGDQLMMLRDPWGIPIQFVNRAAKMI